jgi:TonB family protein
MQPYVTSAFLAAACLLTPVAAGYAPALSQDFSITNKLEGPGTEWIRKLQAWWDVHAYYPPPALQNHQDGTVKLHLVIHPDGAVWTVEVVQGSGSEVLDKAGSEVFHLARLRPFPPGTPAPQPEVNLTLHYVLEHRQSKTPFTISNDPVPVETTVVNTMLERTCTGTAVPIWWSHIPTYWVQATWYRRPDGTPWIRFYWQATGPLYIPVTELGVSAQWNTPPIIRGKDTMRTHYELWPEGDNHIGGKTEDPPGTIDMTCD